MKNRKPVITAGIILVVVATVIFVGALILGNFIEDELQSRQMGTYHVQSREAEVNVLRRGITIRHAVIEDTAANQKFSSPEIKATGIHIFPFVFNDEIIVNKLHIQQPEITVIRSKGKEESGQQKDASTEQDSEIERIRIKQLEITDAAVLLLNKDSGDADTLLSIHSGLEIRNLNIFSDHQQLKFNAHSAENLEVRLTNGTYNLPGGLYKLQFGAINLSTEQRTLNLEDLDFSSLHSKYDIAKQTGAETDWYDITLKQFNIKDISMKALLQDTAVVFGTAVLAGLDANIFRDKRPPFPDKPDSKLPMEMLTGLPLPLYSDSILIKEGNVIYEEHGEESSEPGKITFNQLYASIYNLGTIKDSTDGPTAMAVRARVMNETLLRAEFTFPDNEHTHQYRVSGSMEPVKAAVFNPMLVPAAFVKVEEGQIKGMDFDFTYDNDNSEGNLALQYENLDIILLDKEDGSQKTIKTFLTETFVLQEDNLREDKSYKEGTISFEREKKKSIFNYWWKSLFSGIKDILAF
ncbi:MAG: hypothetical protein ACOC0R_06440 [Mariniphaga sp.]